ncbi:MAG: GGDEF domain-containing protein [Lachnospiraceae bacterium]|nr:GGDEF domain-containing protein [Lachnospiraceae bacterium]
MSVEELMRHFLIQYTVLNGFCAYLILAIAVRNILGKGRALVYQTFARLASYLALVIVLDTVIVLGNDRFYRMPDVLMIFMLSAYFLTITLGSQCFFVYYQMILHPEIRWDSKQHLKSSIVTLVNLGLLIINLSTKQFFYMENHVFHYGEAILLELIMSYGYCAVIAINLRFERRKPENEYREHYIDRMILCAMIPAVAGGIQVLVHGYYPILSLGYAIAVIAMYMDSLENSISKDAMTGLNNKGQLLQEMNQRISHRKENTVLFLFMMDLNRFKQINDKYGHQEGDIALIHFAEALTNAAKEIPHHTFLARFGGDEFLLLVDMPSEGTIEMDRRIASELVNAKKGEDSEIQSYSGMDFQENLERGIWQPGRKQIERRLKIYHWVNRYSGEVHADNMYVYAAEQRKLPEVQQILSTIERAVDDINEKYDKPYKIETSIGVGRLSKNIRTVQGLLSIADEDLYRQKKVAHGEACDIN